MEWTIELWNTAHLITIGVLLVVVLTFGFLMKGKEKNTKNKVLIIISFVNLAIHFLRLLLPEYKENLPNEYKSVTFDSIASALTIMMPFILISKNNVMKDFLFYMGFIAGLISIVYPLQMLGADLQEYDVIRHYICHVLLFTVPFLMVLLGVHELSIKRVPLFPLMFIVIECLILANEVILMEAGFVEFRGGDFLAYNYRNTSFIFGPTEEYAELCEKLVEPIVPKFFKIVPDGSYQGLEKYLPVLWMIVPSFAYLGGASLLLSLLFTKVINKNNSGSNF